MMLKRVNMDYDQELDRWVVEGKHEWYSLHCGETIQLYIAGHTLNARLEYGLTWYIIVDGIALGLFKKQRYTVSIKL